MIGLHIELHIDPTVSYGSIAYTNSARNMDEHESTSVSGRHHAGEQRTNCKRTIETAHVIVLPCWSSSADFSSNQLTNIRADRQQNVIKFPRTMGQLLLHGSAIKVTLTN